MPNEKNIQFIEKRPEGTTVHDKDYSSDYLRGFQSGVLEHEVKKSPRFLKLINNAIKLVKDLANEYETRPIKLDNKMFHVLPHEEFIKIFKTPDEFGPNAVSSVYGLFFDKKEMEKHDELDRFLIMVHEILHQSSVRKLMLQEKNNSLRMREYRTGLCIIHSNDNFSNTITHPMFNGLNEGITQFLTNIIYRKKVRKMSVFANQVHKIEKDMTPADRDNTVRFPKSTESYFWLTSLFLDLAGAIYEKNKDKFKDESEVRDSIINTYFNGNISDLGKMVMTLGPGALRRLAEIGLSDSNEDLIKINNFRKKYGLSEDRWITLKLKKNNL